MEGEETIVSHDEEIHDHGHDHGEDDGHGHDHVHGHGHDYGEEDDGHGHGHGHGDGHGPAHDHKGEHKEIKNEIITTFNEKLINILNDNESLVNKLNEMIHDKIEDRCQKLLKDFPLRRMHAESKFIKGEVSKHLEDNRTF